MRYLLLKLSVTCKYVRMTIIMLTRSSETKTFSKHEMNMLYMGMKIFSQVLFEWCW